MELCFLKQPFLVNTALSTTESIQVFAGTLQLGQQGGVSTTQNVHRYFHAFTHGQQRLDLNLNYNIVMVWLPQAETVQGWGTEDRTQTETGEGGHEYKRESLPSSAGAVSRCRHIGHKQKVFSPLTSSTGPSAGRQHRNAYSPGVTATVCHQSVRFTVLPADNASTRAQLRFITRRRRRRKTNRHDEIYTSGLKVI